MHSSAKGPTKAERDRMARIVELGCVACRIGNVRDRRFCGPPQVHHLLDGGVRRGHAFTICLGLWHHVGDPLYGWTYALMIEEFGPSLAHGSRPFRALYGDDATLLAYQDRLLAENPE